MLSNIYAIRTYFTKWEWFLWLFSIATITAAFLLSDNARYLTLCASLIGVTSLIFCAKGNPVGQALMVVFSILYAVISYSAAYYGEMLTYLGMTMPMAVFSFIAWLRHPYEGNRAQVRVNRIGRRELALLALSALPVTALSYFLLAAFRTANLTVSTLSVTTSFLAAYLTLRRSPLYAAAYAVNDIVLLCLWGMMAVHDRSCLPVAVCFAVFLINDFYTFRAWSKHAKVQAGSGTDAVPAEGGK